MDFFWLIPLGFVATIFFWALYIRIKREPPTVSTPRVIVDKPPTEPLIDPGAKEHDWSKRPCGSFLEWLGDRR